MRITILFYYTLYYILYFNSFELCSGEAMNMLNTSLALLSDPNRQVRVVFSASPRRALSGCSMEVIGQFVDRVLNVNATTKDSGVKETLIMTAQSLGVPVVP